MKIQLLIIIALASCSDMGDNTIKSPDPEIQKINFEDEYSCNYSSSVKVNSVFAFESDKEEEEALRLIMGYTGLPSNFSLVAADVENAAAVIYKNRRYILYNQKFIEGVKKKTKNKYGYLSILAHEVGHHLSGHTFSEDESRPNLELEADRFSGFVLAKMGATIQESCSAMEIFGNNTESSTHPSKKTRITAIVNGWKEASVTNENNRVNELVSPVNTKKRYVIEVVSDEKYITLRNRSLSPDEYKIANSGTAQARLLNTETIIANLPNGTELEILSSIGNTYYVKAQTDKGELLGYITKKFSGKSTVRSF